MADYTTITAAETDPGKPVSSALIKALEENPRAIAEAVPAVANNLRPTQLLGTLTTTSGATQTLSSLDLTNFRSLWVVWDGVSHDNISARSPRIAGGAAASLVDASISSATFFYAQASIDLISGEGVVIGCGASGSPAVDQPALAHWIRPAITNATTSIVFSWSGAGNFDAGSIRVYGRK